MRFLKKKHNLLWLMVGSACIAAYILASPRYSTQLYANALFKPYRFPEGDYDISFIEGIAPENVFFKSQDGTLLHGWFLRKPGAKYTLLFNHGNTGNLSGRIKQLGHLLKCDLNIFIYDYRGYGRSEGKATLAGVCSDGVSAFDYLIKERSISPADIILYGESLGVAISCEIAAERKAAALILQSGFSSLWRIGREILPMVRIFPRSLFPILDSASRINKIGSPLLIIHGTKDTVVPFAHAEELFERAIEPKTFVKLDDAAHSDLWDICPEKFRTAICEFINGLS